MVKPLQNTGFSFRWPATGWLIWLTGSYLGLKLITLGLVLITLGTAGLNYLTTGDWQTSWHTPLVGWTMLTVVIWLYWNYRIKGKKPTSDTRIDTDVLKYFSFHGRHIFWRALNLATQNHATYLGSHHLLAALHSNLGYRLTLARLELEEVDVVNAVANDGDIFYDVLTSALALGVAEHSRISWEDLLRGIIKHSPGLSQLLAKDKISVAEALSVVEWSKRNWYYRPAAVRSGLMYELLSPKRNINKAWSARPTPVLDRFSQNLTELARIGTLASARVRQQEADEAVRILSRGEQNSAILIGEPGVGKTSVVGDIALKILDNQIPSLKDYKLVALNVGAMLGAQVSFEKLFSQATREAAGAGNVILFIGNIGQLTKAKTSEGFDLSGILLSALEESGLQMIATASPKDYKKYVEDKEELKRFFTAVHIDELDEARALLVLEDKSRSIEGRHGVLVTLSAIKAAITNSVKFIHDSRLPDKAVDLLDEAGVEAARQGAKRVQASHVEAVMSSRTNVPVGALTASEKDKLKNLAAAIQEKFIGQDEAVTGVVDALKRARLGVAKGNRPIGTFLFLGPTGVGKTELAKRLAENYFGNEADMIRLDMSEYQTRESAYRIFGAPAVSGDVALGGGVLTEAVRKTPFAVVLLDEVEKAHPDILNVFLQVLDEGRMTDNLGNTIDFTNTIIIATSNAQARFIQDAVRSQMAYDVMRDKLIEMLIAESFPPEFINRFDGVLVFKPLTPAELAEVAKIKIKGLVEHIKREKNITLHVTDDAVAKLAELGYDPAFGARPLERVIRERIETNLANQILANDNLDEVTITSKDLSDE
ncbi:MAG: ATP-dependent Clp protease ATP-binding subunit [Patescibacteria group bacterium]|nr:ATP-dependent Clp protease ATP-binding subunit [Patescibacteria group bacterium]